MHDLVDDLEERGLTIDIDVMRFAAFAPAAIKQNLGRCNACHRWAIRFHHDAGQRFMAVSVYDRASDSMCPRFFGIFPSSCLSALTNQSSRSHAEGGVRVGRAFIGS